jgi:hypothetical protein
VLDCSAVLGSSGELCCSGELVIITNGGFRVANDGDSGELVIVIISGSEGFSGSTGGVLELEGFPLI